MIRYKRYKLLKEYKTIAHNYDIGAEVAFVGGKYWIGFESFTEEQMNYLKGWVELIPEVTKYDITSADIVQCFHETGYASSDNVLKWKQSKSPSIPESKEIIEVGFTWYNIGQDETKQLPPFSHLFKTIEKIPEDKFLLIKQAIEAVLNNDGGWGKMKQHWEECAKIKSQFGESKYTQQQMDKAREDTWMYARTIRDNFSYALIPEMFRYPTLQDYIQFIKQDK